MFFENFHSLVSAEQTCTHIFQLNLPRGEKGSLHQLTFTCSNLPAHPQAFVAMQHLVLASQELGGYGLTVLVLKKSGRCSLNNAVEVVATFGCFLLCASKPSPGLDVDTSGRTGSEQRNWT